MVADFTLGNNKNMKRVRVKTLAEALKLLLKSDRANSSLKTK